MVLEVAEDAGMTIRDGTTVLVIERPGQTDGTKAGSGVGVALAAVVVVGETAGKRPRSKDFSKNRPIVRLQSLFHFTDLFSALQPGSILTIILISLSLLAVTRPRLPSRISICRNWIPCVKQSKNVDTTDRHLSSSTQFL